MTRPLLNPLVIETQAFGSLQSPISSSDVALESQDLLPPMRVSADDRIRDDTIFGGGQEVRALHICKDIAVTKSRRKLVEGAVCSNLDQQESGPKNDSWMRTKTAKPIGGLVNNTLMDV